MIDNLALAVAHFCMGYFLWKTFRYEMDRGRKDASAKLKRARNRRS